MQFYEYNGYAIYPAPHLVEGYNYWMIELIIKNKNVIKKYDSDNFFSTKDEAVFHSIIFGKKLIDEGIVSLNQA
jgi:hypothetical protein